MENSKINELIAEHIMGLEIDREKDGKHEAFYIHKIAPMHKTVPIHEISRPVPDYCNDIKLAFDVVEKIGDIKISANTKECFDLDYIEGVYYASWGFNTSSHKSLPMAIALAALEVIRAKGIEIE